HGQIAFSQGDLATAYSLLEESVLLYKEVGARHGIAESLCQLARVVTAQGNYTAAYALYEESLAIGKELNNVWLIAPCLEGLASVIALQGKPAWAAQLWGAAETLREANGVPISPLERSDYERSIFDACSRLGKAAFAAAWSQGRAMAIEQVLTAQGQEMVSAPTTTVASTTPPPTYPAGLTAREVEVLRLVAKGLTNNEIAENLGLSEKTIAHHLTHIFNKTTSENRAAAAAFAIRHGLA
ncbi:MAG: LuxR C-terminal-related transcriptional regulator, partial [Chloroflexota bacterium]|nr:LuxR C-terminal-related transcriptional regulator [Chloroflexota bacterium]